MSKDNREMNIEEKFNEYWKQVPMQFVNNASFDSFARNGFIKGYELGKQEMFEKHLSIIEKHIDLTDELKKEMQEKLDAAVEVIRFYAYEWEQDQSVFGGYGTYMTSLKNDTEEISKNTRSYGKRARDFLKARGE